MAPAPDDQQRPAVASDGTNFFVVWEDRRNSDTMWDIFGARVSPGGEVLDPGGIPISTYPENYQHDPAVAWDGAGYLVAWADDRDNTPPRNALRVYGRRVRTDGTVLGSEDFRISAYYSAFWPAIAFNGTDHLVVVSEWLKTDQDAFAIVGYRVTPGGVVRDPNGLFITRGSGSLAFPSIATLGDEWFVVWLDGVTVRGARVSRDGAVSAPQTLAGPAIAFADSRTAVAGLGSNYLVSWVGYQQITNSGYAQEIRGTWVSRAGLPLDTFTIFAHANTTVPGLGQVNFKAGFPAVTAGLAEFLVTWQGSYVWSNGWDHLWLSDLHGAKVSRTGGVTAPFPICTARQEQSHARGAFNGATFLVGWEDARLGPADTCPASGSFDIYAARVQGTSAVEPDGFLVSGNGWAFPLIVEQPAGRTVAEGQSAFFRVLASGAPPLYYQWRKDGVALFGQTGDCLELRPVTLADAGQYDVVVWNTGGVVTSDPATLTVLPAPTGPGSLDITFDPTAGGGRVGIAGDRAWVGALARQPDGKTLLGGYFIGLNGRPRMNIGRLNADGTLDLGFTAQTDGWVSQVTLQPDDRIVLVGEFTSVNGEARAYVARLKADGTLDPGFAPAFQGTSHRFEAGTMTVCALDSQGRILVGGSFLAVNGLARTNLVRLLPDGSVDAEFVAADCYTGLGSLVRALVVQPDDRLLVAPSPSEPGQRLLRLHPDGRRDTTFYPRVIEEQQAYVVWCVAGQPDGKILAAFNNQMVRLNADGSSDGTFASWTGFENGSPRAISLQSDGKIVVGGEFTTVNSTPRRGIARFQSNGALDEAFDPGGLVPTSESYADRPSVRALLVLPDGDLLAGTAFYGAVDTDLALIRLNPDGTRDGTLAARVALAGARVLAVRPQADGRVLVGGQFTAVNGQPRNSLARLQADGALDLTFNAGAGPDHNQGARPTIEALALQADGRVFAGGRFTSFCGLASPGLVRLYPDGRLDTTFVSSLHESGVRVGAIALQTNGRMLVGGSFRMADAPGDSLVRLHPDGSPDGSFQPDALTIGEDDGVFGIIVQSDGKILACGEINTPHFGLARFNSDGSPDAGFVPPTEFLEWMYAMAQQPDGKTLVAGRQRVLRLHTDGSLDFQRALNGATGCHALATQPDGGLLFDDEGVVRHLWPNGDEDFTFQARTAGATDTPVISAIAVQADGQVLLGGCFSSVNHVPVTQLARIDGSVPQFPPSVALVSPTNGATFLRPAHIPLQAEANDADGRVVRVEFFSGHIPLGQATAPLPGHTNLYQMIWTNTLTGFYEVSAVATDDRGYSAASAPVWVRVVRTAAPPRFTLTDLGALREGGDSYPRAINNVGDVVGTAGVAGSYHAFLFRNGQMTDLGALTGVKSSAADINDAGVVVGTWMTGDAQTANYSHHGFIYSNGVMRALPEPAATLHFLPEALNNAGAVAGAIVYSNGNQRAALWDQGALRVLGTLPGGSGAHALAINNVGLLAGYAADAVGELTAVLFAGADVLNLGLLPDTYGSVALDLNDTGQVVGYCSGASSTLGFLYSNGAMVPLPMLPGAAHLYPNAINSRGQVAGSSTEYAEGDYGFDSYSRAVLLREGMMEDLNDLVPADSAWVLTDATDMNCRGQIVGYGLHHGLARGWLLTPIPQPPVSPGSVDLSFRATVVGEGTVLAVAQQPDGRLLIGGSFTNLSGVACAGLARLWPDGTPDTNFRVRLSAEYDRRVSAITVQPDGRIVIGGCFTSVNGAARNHAACLNPDGSLSGGISPLPDTFNQVTAIARQSDGKVLVAGHNYDQIGSVGVLIRFSADGSLDPGYSILTHNGYGIMAMAVEPDDQALIAGEFDPIGGLGGHCMARINPNGSVDSGFAPGPGSELYGLALQPDGRILVSGYVYLNDVSGVVRILPDGSPDPTFHPALIPPPDWSLVTVQPDDKILIGGSWGNPGPGHCPAEPRWQPGPGL